MSVPTDQMGSTAVATPQSGSSSGMSGVTAALTAINPTLGSILSLSTGSTSNTGSSLGNFALIAVGVVLVLGALLISSKTDVIQVARSAAA